MAVWDIKERNNLVRANQASRGDRGVFSGGLAAPNDTSDNIDFIQISTAGNAADFGNLSSVNRGSLSAVASSTRGLYFGGGSNNNVENTIDYFTIASTGNVADFGNLSAVRRGGSGVGSETRGISMGGSSSGYSDIIEFMTFASLGNAIDFGNLGAARNIGAPVSSPTRGIRMGGVQ